VLQRINFHWRYFRQQTPWDTNITPPELVELVEQEHFAPGRALDLGCGTGTNAIYLAQHGFQVVGVDYVGRAVSIARAKAARANVPVEFRRADVLAPGPLADGSMDLILDIGCFHTLAAPDRIRYVENTRRWTHPGSLVLSYAFFPITMGKRRFGIDRAEMEKLYTPDYNLMRYADDGRSAWYRWQRKKE